MALIEKVARSLARQWGTTTEWTQWQENAQEVTTVVLADLKEHYRKSAIPKWDIQFLEKYAKENDIVI